MEYLTYILITLGILVVCLVFMRPRAMPLQGASKGPSKQKGELAATERTDPGQVRAALHRSMKNVPTPWGWPGHHPARATSLPNAEEVHGVSESIHSFVERLFTEKRTVDSKEYLLRKNASLRTQVEDRYGRSSTMKELPYQPVNAPRLRDPSAPHDQMDNFPSGKLDKIVKNIPRQPKVGGVGNGAASSMPKTTPKELRTPWGW